MVFGEDCAWCSVSRPSTVNSLSINCHPMQEKVIETKDFRAEVSMTLAEWNGIKWNVSGVAIPTLNADQLDAEVCPVPQSGGFPYSVCTANVACSIATKSLSSLLILSPSAATMVGSWFYIPRYVSSLLSAGCRGPRGKTDEVVARDETASDVSLFLYRGHGL
jgi:hypothetical protein